MIPCGGAKVNRIAGFFRARGGVFAGACPSAPCVVGLPKRCPRDGVPLTALARPAPGERTISNAEVPLPRSPLSLATGTAHRKACSIGFAPKRRLPAALGNCLAGTISAVDGSVQGCRGRSPRRNKLKVSPFPPGRGAGGWGKEIKPKARLAGDQPGKPSAGYHSGRDSQCRRGTAAGHLHGRDYKCRRRFSAGVPGAKPPAK